MCINTFTQISFFPKWQNWHTALPQEKLEDTKGVIGSCKSKDRQYNDQQKKDKGQKAIYKR